MTFGLAGKTIRFHPGEEANDAAFAG